MDHQAANIAFEVELNGQTRGFSTFCASELGLAKVSTITTLKDISRETGISVTQVSRALGGHEDVSAKTRMIVEEAARRLEYRPNTIARSLKTGRTGLIAMVLPAEVGESVQELVFDLLLGFSNAAHKKGYRFLLHASDERTSLVDPYKDLVGGGGVDGFIIIEPLEDDPRIRFLLETNIPHVVHGKDPEQKHSFVDIDNHGVGYHLTRRLLELGHRRIAFLNGSASHSFAQARARGYRVALTEFGIGEEGALHSWGMMSYQRGQDALSDLMQSDDPATAIIAGNTMIARGVYDKAKSMGLRIPDDISVLAHDDVLQGYNAINFEPRLGGSRSPLSDAWRILAQIVATQIDEGAASVTQQYLEVSYALDSASAARIKAL